MQSSAQLPNTHSQTPAPETNLGYTPLHTAVENCDIDEVKRLIESGADVNKNTNPKYDFWVHGTLYSPWKIIELKKMSTPVRLAIIQKNSLMVELLLENNAQIDLIDMEIALTSGNHEIRKLVLNKIDIAQYIEELNNHKIADHCHVRKWEDDDAYKYNIKEQLNDRLESVLVLLADEIIKGEQLEESSEILDIFLGKLSTIIQNLTLRDTIGPAIEYGSLEIIKLFTKHNVIIHNQLIENFTNLEMKDESPVAKLIFPLWALVASNAKGCKSDGEYVNKIETIKNREEIAHLLIDQGADVNESNGDQDDNSTEDYWARVDYNILYLAIFGGSVDLVEYLFKAGAKKQVCNGDDIRKLNPVKEFLDIPLRNKNEPMTKLLVKHGIPITEEDKKLAQDWGNDDIITLFALNENPEPLLAVIDKIYLYSQVELSHHEQKSLKCLEHLPRKIILNNLIKDSEITMEEALLMINHAQNYNQPPIDIDVIPQSDNETSNVIPLPPIAVSFEQMQLEEVDSSLGVTLLADDSYEETGI